MLKLSVATLLCGCLSVASTAASGADYAPAVGQRHPDFVLPKISDRQAVSLAQFRGTKVLLVQFASW